MDSKAKKEELDALKIKLKQLIKDVQEGKVDKAKAADEILSLNEQIDKITDELKLPI